jgi:hypothetical protein
VTAPTQDYLEKALSDLEGQRRRLIEMEKAMAAVVGRAQSANRMVRVKVDRAGRLEELKFEGTRHRTMAPAELEAAIVETVQRAQDDAAEQMAAAASGMVPDSVAALGVDADGMPSVDLDSMFRHALSLLEAPLFDGLAPQGASAPGTASGAGGKK